jgi:hypothetical protein
VESSNGASLLTETERDFADALTAFFGAMENLTAVRKRLLSEGGRELESFLSTIPEEQRPLASAQWPMISMMLNTIAA